MEIGGLFALITVLVEYETMLRSARIRLRRLDDLSRRAAEGHSFKATDRSRDRSRARVGLAAEVAKRTG
jgi:hypothetical protein